MYFIRKGFVEILSEDLSHVVNKLGSGGYFGEVCMVTIAYVHTYVCVLTLQVHYCSTLEVRRPLSIMFEILPKILLGIS